MGVQPFIRARVVNRTKELTHIHLNELQLQPLSRTNWIASIEKKLIKKILIIIFKMSGSQYGSFHSPSSSTNASILDLFGTQPTTATKSTADDEFGDFVTSPSSSSFPTFISPSVPIRPETAPIKKPTEQDNRNPKQYSIQSQINDLSQAPSQPIRFGQHFNPNGKVVTAKWDEVISARRGPQNSKGVAVSAVPKQNDSNLHHGRVARKSGSMPRDRPVSLIDTKRDPDDWSPEVNIMTPKNKNRFSFAGLDILTPTQLSIPSNTVSTPTNNDFNDWEPVQIEKKANTTTALAPSQDSVQDRTLQTTIDNGPASDDWDSFGDFQDGGSSVSSPVVASSLKDTINEQRKITVPMAPTIPSHDWSTSFSASSPVAPKLTNKSQKTPLSVPDNDQKQEIDYSETFGDFQSPITMPSINKSDSTKSISSVEQNSLPPPPFDNIPEPSALLHLFQTNVLPLLPAFFTSLVPLPYSLRKRALSHTRTRHFLAGFLATFQVCILIMAGRHRRLSNPEDYAAVDRASRETLRIWAEDVVPRLGSANLKVEELGNVHARGPAPDGEKTCVLCGLAATEDIRMNVTKNDNWKVWSEKEGIGHVNCLEFWRNRAAYGIE